MLEAVRWVLSNANVRALQAAQPRAHNSAADEPAIRHTFGQRIHKSLPNSSLAPRRRTRLQPINIHGRPLAEGRMGLCTGRKGAGGGREHGAEGSMGRFQGRQGRKGGWGGREHGAEGSMGRKGVRGGREAGAEGTRSMGRKGGWGARRGTPRHTDFHFDPQATTFLSPPGGIYLISPSWSLTSAE